jgi:fumarylacetoacetase
MRDEIDQTHDPALRSWVDTANKPGADFPVQNLPFGVFRSRTSAEPRIGVAIGDQILDLRQSADGGLLEELPSSVVAATRAQSLNVLMALGHPATSTLRRRLSQILTAEDSAAGRALVPLTDVEMSVPSLVGNYTDFYASLSHATNVGRLFRPDDPLLPNFKYVPIAYHGRSSSIVISGETVRRPAGQVKTADERPAYRPSQRLDYEAEIGCFVGSGNQLGRPIPIDHAEEHIFGLCVVNDWSARDIQAWEYQPLGPFLSKSFATTVSPWVVTYEALAPFRCPAFERPQDDPAPLDHLFSPATQAQGAFDITLEVSLRSEAMRRRGLAPMVMSRSSFRDMYWTIAQMLTHHTSNGCNLMPGDLLASGTLSGPAKGAQGCLLEITEGGRVPLQLPGGETRTFLADGDEVVMRAFCERPGFVRIGFGECRGLIGAAKFQD